MTYTKSAQICTTHTGNWSIDSFLGLVSTSAHKDAVAPGQEPVEQPEECSEILLQSLGGPPTRIRQSWVC
jgi:hypothetical protein